MYANEELLVQRIQNHLLIEDVYSAKIEAEEALNQYPYSKPIQEARIKVLSKIGEEKQLLAAWNQFISLFPEESSNAELLEGMAWGIIQKASDSTSQITRAMALLGALFSQDIKGVKVLQRGMQDSSALIRALAVFLSSQLRDTILQEEVYRLFFQEKNGNVRLEVIKAIGSMKIKPLKTALIKMIGDDKTSQEERLAAIESWILLAERTSTEEIECLSNSNRAGFRLLACQILLHFIQNHTAVLKKLIDDPDPRVRAAAIHTLGSIRPNLNEDVELLQKVENHLSDRDPYVAITAAWCLTLYGPEKGLQALESWVHHENQEIRLFAAGAIAAVGKYGISLGCKILGESTDPYISLNIAIGLLQQREKVLECCEILCHMIKDNSERWRWEKENFNYLIPAKLKPLKRDELKNPEMMNQIVRLEVLNILALFDMNKAEDSIKKFLTERRLQVFGAAAILLLGEGDETAIQLIKHLLQDENPLLRLQAALVLAIWGKNPEALKILQEAYPSAPKEMKEKILEAIGRVGSIDSIPFLLERFKEPFSSIKIIAATAIIECLNH